MPLVKSTTDDDFVVEVSKEIEDQCTRMKDHAAAMIEEYLRRRLQAVTETHRMELVSQKEQMEQERSAERGVMQQTTQQLEKAKARLVKAAEALARANERLCVQRAFLMWGRAKEARHEQQQKSEARSERTSMLNAARALGRWRLFAMSRRKRRQLTDAQVQWQCREAELKGEIEVYEKELEEERSRSERTDGELRGAFVRGVCALNREAVHALRGEGGGDEGDVASIHAILSKSREGGTMGGGGDVSQGDSHPWILGSQSHHDQHHQQPPRTTICPVHMRDAEHNFYHKCYAPGYCPHNDADSSPAYTTDRHRTILVRADPSTARSYDAGPPLRVPSSGGKRTAAKRF